jgi:L-asparaginase
MPKNYFNSMGEKRKVLVIYTGGTIGMMKDAETGLLGPVNFDKLADMVPEVNQIDAEVRAISFAKPIDSSNMDLTHWTKLAQMIEEHYHAFDGFVILHGSDTMAYTASALSFMLINLATPNLIIRVIRTTHELQGRSNIVP